MKKHLWFGPKRYGWGWTPITWQGWLIIVIYMISVIFLSLPLKSASYPLRYVTIIYIPSILILTGFLLLFCAVTSEKPVWHWGADKKVNPPVDVGLKNLNK